MEGERAWNVLTAGLMGVLGALQDMETVNFAPRAARHLDDPFVVTAGLDRAARQLRCYAAGPVSEPQAFPLTAEQDATLRALGWTPPDPSAKHAEKHTYWCAHPCVLQDARERGHAAAMLVATLRRVHGCRSPADVEVQAGFAGPAVKEALAELRELLELSGDASGSAG